FAGSPTEGIPAGLHGAEHGLRGRRVPRLRRDVDRRRAATGLPRGPRLRQRRDRLGGRLVKARRKAITSGPAGVARAAKGATGHAAKRRPTVRRLKSAFVPVQGRAARPVASPSIRPATPPPSAGASPTASSEGV